MRKLIDTITLISALLTLTMTGGVIYSYLYIKNPENIEKTVANGMEAETIIIYSMQKRLLHIAGYEEHISSISSFASRNFFRDNPSKA